MAAAQAQFVVPSSNLSSLSLVVSASASMPGTTGMLYAYNWSTKQYTYLGATALGTSQTLMKAAVPGPIANYVSPSGQINVVVRSVMPTRLTRTGHTLSIDAIQMGSSSSSALETESRGEPFPPDFPM